MYMYGGAATLIVTFAVIGVLVSAPVDAAPTGVTSAESPAQSRNPAGVRVRGGTLAIMRAGTVSALLLTILTGFIGTQDPTDNVSMTLFWVLFLLALAYLTLVVGDVYRLINPWRVLVEIAERTALNLSKARLSYPPQLAYWPAFFLYAVLIWMELFVAPTPRALSTALLVYSAITFVGVGAFGKTIWFERADPFGVFFRLIGILAPVQYRSSEHSKTWYAHWRAPFSGALIERPEHLSLVVILLLILASTSYDAIHETTLWIGLYWKNMLWLFQPLWDEDLGQAQNSLMAGYLIYRQVGLLFFPFLYLSLYWFALRSAKAVTRTTVPTRTLALSFCYSLLPIAIAYHFTHYFPFLMAEVGNLGRRLSDPFGFGWNLLSLTRQAESVPLPMNFIWHTQVTVLILGHLASVYLSHLIAIQIFSIRRWAVVSQLPLLVLMVAYTIFGMWILSLPLAI
jgi:hypothetical protein